MRLSTQQLIDHLQSLADELGRRPSLQDLRDHGDHSASTYYDRFGSWQDALAAAGFEPRSPNQKLSRDDLLDTLQELDARVDGSPSAADMREHGNHWPSTYRRRFGSWNDALEAAGIEPINNDEPRIPEQALLEDIRTLSDELGRQPTPADIRTDGRYALQTYINRFGAWTIAVERALGTADTNED